jgi:hypothetical protein
LREKMRNWATNHDDWSIKCGELGNCSPTGSLLFASSVLTWHIPHPQITWLGTPSAEISTVNSWRSCNQVVNQPTYLSCWPHLRVKGHWSQDFLLQAKQDYMWLSMIRRLDQSDLTIIRHDHDWSCDQQWLGNMPGSAPVC